MSATPPHNEPGSATEGGWSWDPTLYAGTADHYAVGRMPYPPEIATELQQALALTGGERLLDVGCGPGTLTLLLASVFGDVIGVDPDPGMLEVAARLAGQAGIVNTRWRQLRGEDLPADLPPVDVVTFAQSFHWMDRPRVASAVRRMLGERGALVHVHANTHEGTRSPVGATAPAPPHGAIRELVQRYLGEQRRAGRGVLAAGTPGGESQIYRAAGFTGPQELSVPGRVVERTADQVVSAVHSLSSAAPPLFQDRLAAFDADLRTLLRATAADGRFEEETAPIGIDIWR